MHNPGPEIIVLKVWGRGDGGSEWREERDISNIFKIKISLEKGSINRDNYQSGDGTFPGFQSTRNL